MGSLVFGIMIISFEYDWVEPAERGMVMVASKDILI